MGDMIADAVGEATRPLLHNPLVQAMLCAVGYALHMCVLSRRALNIFGASLGYDTLAGLGVLAGVAWRRVKLGLPPVPYWLSGATAVPGEQAVDAAARVLSLGGERREEKTRLLATAAMVLGAPFLFAQTGPLFDVLLYSLVALGVPLSSSGLAGARLLLEQSVLYWLLFKLIGSRHEPFFKTDKWVRWGWRKPWLLPVLGGYAASLALFNLVEPINQALLPHLAYCAEGPVSKLANPADKSVFSLLIAAITPCVGAPLFEEVQSRAFLLQALTAALPLRLALPASGLIFGVQHLQLGLVLPLSVTGFFWGLMYVHSGNLIVPILIHALWNARIFFGSFLGL